MIPKHLIFLHTSGTRSQNKVNVKSSSHNRPRRRTRGVKVQLYSLFNLRTRWEVRGQRRAPAFLVPQKESRYPFYRRLRGPQGRSGQTQKVSPPPQPGFDPRAIQPIASHYTDWAMPARFNNGWNEERVTLSVCNIPLAICLDRPRKERERERERERENHQSHFRADT